MSWLDLELSVVVVLWGVLVCNEKRVNRVVLEKAAQLGKLGLDLVG